LTKERRHITKVFMQAGGDGMQFSIRFAPVLHIQLDVIYLAINHFLYFSFQSASVVG